MSESLDTAAPSAVKPPPARAWGHLNRHGKWALVPAGFFGLWLLAGMFGDSDPVDADAVTFTVERGRVEVGVETSGSIQDIEKIVIKSKVHERVTLISLIDEGTRVKEGELLVELDKSQLEESLAARMIDVQNAEASFVEAQENLKIKQSENESEVSKAEMGLRFAGLDLRKYNDGEYPRDLQEARNEITIAKEELSRARDKFEWSKKLESEGFITRSELQADELSVRRRELDLSLSEKKLEVLQAFTHPKKLEELEQDVIQKEAALDRARRKASADLVMAETKVRTREANLLQQSNRAEDLAEQIKNCRILAPADGMVVYASTLQPSWRNDGPLKVGDDIRRDQELIHLPTNAGMLAEVAIYEATLQKVEVGMPARITVDALPDRVYAGRVTTIAPLPTQEHRWRSDGRKTYKAEIVLDDNLEGLRTGMSCHATIVVGEFEDVLYVPLQSVIKVDGRDTVYVRSGSRAKPREVRLGLDNNRMVIVEEGLKPGERVMLAPPLAEGGKNGAPST